LLESSVGFVVLVVASVFFYFAYSYSAKSISSGYVISASFDRIDGVGLGSDVKIGGVKVGSVSKITLSSETYLVTVEMRLDKTVKIPRDTAAAITSEGLIGGKIVSLIPGGDKIMLKAGETLAYTQGSVSLESLIGKMMFSSGTK
jgi:phospholipid/cholesterol/gamma-HCH transport system substrate-binding protein